VRRLSGENGRQAEDRRRHRHDELPHRSGAPSNTRAIGSAAVRGNRRAPGRAHGMPT
jgi:hypothetical protein